LSKAVFLDRDGVINEVLTNRVKFVNHPNELYLLPGVGEAIKRLNDAGFAIFVVTNQGGVGLGFLKEDMLKRIHERMRKDLASFGATVKDIAYCPHKPKAGCRCRKPGAKMITDMADKHKIFLDESYMIGDRDVDIEAGRKAGLLTILVGGDTYENSDHHATNLSDAVEFILKR
jgi:D-glycero-D-manno-heptose 1,7-bisphosphate phosphatase